MELIPRAKQTLSVVEVDPGIDDALALMVLLGAWKLGFIKIVAVVCSNGNMNLTQSCENTKKVMDAAHISDNEIPLFEGVGTAVIEDIPKDYFFGQDGFGDINPPVEAQPRTTFSGTHLAEYINEMSKTYNAKISYISLGSLTFLMTLLLQQPYFKFKDIWIMGGNNLGVDYQEYNFRVDPEAVHFVLRQWDRIPIYLGTFQNCENIKPTMEWRRTVLGQIDSDIIELINKAEASKLTKMEDDDIWLQYDPVVAVAYAYQDSITCVDTLKVNITLDLNTKSRCVLVDGDARVKSIRNLKLHKYMTVMEKTARALA